MTEILLDRVTALIDERRSLEEVCLRIGAGEQWAIVGANGSGKTSLGKLLCNGLKVVAGTVRTVATSGYVSFEKLNEILELERYNDDSDFLGYTDEGTRVGEFIGGVGWREEPKLKALAAKLAFCDLLERGIRFLSTGEMRKALICRALMEEPELLVLDEPFDGLDVGSSGLLRDLIGGCVAKGMRVVLLLNRFSEIVPEITHVAYVKGCRILMSGSRDEMLASESLRRLHAFHYTLPTELPEVDGTGSCTALSPGAPLIEMREVTVSYGEKTILNRLNWTVRPGEHWRISGPNGAGKSTLLSLVSGDNAQAYANDITLFGIKRGSGESVWDIKKRIGLVSTSLQQNYRVGVTVRLVVISGFFDSIGVYGNYTKKQQEIAREWLEMLHMERHAEAPFRNLSYGEQRIVLLARAMVKQPDLLILDEPCQGLDDINREMVLKLIDHLGKTGRSQILYVTHHQEDDLPCLTDRLALVPADGGGFTARTGREQV